MWWGEKTSPTRVSSEGGDRDMLGRGNTPPTRVLSEGGCGDGSGLGGWCFIH